VFFNGYFPGYRSVDSGLQPVKALAGFNPDQGTAENNHHHGHQGGSHQQHGFAYCFHGMKKYRLRLPMTTSKGGIPE
jgi:hypothetical protein